MHAIQPEFLINCKHHFQLQFNLPLKVTEKKKKAIKWLPLWCTPGWFLSNLASVFNDSVPPMPPQQNLLHVFRPFMIRLLLLISFLSNTGTAHTDTMLPKWYLASLLCFHHQDKHTLDFTELRRGINSNSKNKRPHRTELCWMKQGSSKWGCRQGLVNKGKVF